MPTTTIAELKDEIARRAAKAQESAEAGRATYERTAARSLARAVEQAREAVRSELVAQCWATIARDTEDFDAADLFRRHAAQIRRLAINQLEGSSGSSCGYTRAVQADRVRIALEAALEYEQELRHLAD